VSASQHKAPAGSVVMGQACQRRAPHTLIGANGEGVVTASLASSSSEKGPFTASEPKAATATTTQLAVAENADEATKQSTAPRTASEFKSEKPPLTIAKNAGDTATERGSTKYSVDYSRFANLADSDDENAEDSKAVQHGAEAPDLLKSKWKGTNPSEQERMIIVDDMMEMCRRSYEEMKQQFAQNAEKPTCNAKLPTDYKKPVETLSLAQLAKYKCSNERMLVSHYGDIFDVSSRPDRYGYGPQAFQSGKDITWCVITGKQTVENCNRFYDIFKLDQEHLGRYLQIICQRLVSMEDEFGEPVGRLKNFVNERDLPPAPTEEIPECNQQ